MPDNFESAARAVVEELDANVSEETMKRLTTLAEKTKVPPEEFEGMMEEADGVDERVEIYADRKQELM